MERNVQFYWDRFLLETNKDPNTKCLDTAYFGHNEHTATKLLTLPNFHVIYYNIKSIYDIIWYGKNIF